MLQKDCEIEGIKQNLWINITPPLWQWDEFHLWVWSWLRGGLPQGYVQFDVERDLVQYESKVETIMGVHS
jgi:hypothetical protein